MFKENDEKLNKILSAVEDAAGWKIRKFAKHVQEDAWQEAIIAYLEGKDIVEHLVQWHRKERRYEKKILAFTRARPLKRDKEEIIKISKDYR